MTLITVGRCASATGTRIFAEDGTEICGVRSATVRFAVDEVVTATIETVADLDEVNAQVLLDAETLRRSAAALGQRLVPVNEAETEHGEHLPHSHAGDARLDHSAAFGQLMEATARLNAALVKAASVGLQVDLDQMFHHDLGSKNALLQVVLKAQ